MTTWKVKWKNLHKSFHFLSLNTFCISSAFTYFTLVPVPWLLIIIQFRLFSYPIVLKISFGIGPGLSKLFANRSIKFLQSPPLASQTSLFRNLWNCLKTPNSSNQRIMHWFFYYPKTNCTILFYFSSNYFKNFIFNCSYLVPEIHRNQISYLEHKGHQDHLE